MFRMTSQDYVDYLRDAAAVIRENKDYITELDAATGDGDHWANMNKGFEKLVADGDDLAALAIPDLFKKIGMTLMSTVGGSSGVLYGSAYLAAAKALAGQECIDEQNLGRVLAAMDQAMMERGDSKPGFKTMIDALDPAVKAYEEGLAKNADTQTTLRAVKAAAIAGAEATKDMEAVRGRAYYQQNKGVGHLDPGAVTMSYQIVCLVDHILALDH